MNPALYIRLLLEDKLEEYFLIENYIKSLDKGSLFTLHDINNKLNLKLTAKRIANYGQIFSKLNKKLGFDFVKKDAKYRSNLYIKVD